MNPSSRPDNDDFFSSLLDPRADSQHGLWVELTADGNAEEVLYENGSLLVDERIEKHR